MFNFRIKSVLPMIMLIIFLISSSFAQVQDTRPQENDMYRQNAELWTLSLNNRLNLTEDQQTQINSILMDYQTKENQLGAVSDTKTLKSDVNRQIEGVLDDNQRTNWDAYSTTWWTDIDSGREKGTDIDVERKGLDTDTDMKKDTSDTPDDNKFPDDDDIR